MTCRLVAGLIFTVGAWQLLCRLPAARAETLTLDSAIESVDWTALNDLDLSAFGNLDEEQARAICRQLQERFQGEYVLELAPLRQVAVAVVPLLEQHADTRPYAAWLRARLDYFEVADTLRVVIPAPHLDLRPAPLPPVNPTPEWERRVWVEHLRQEPAPTRAESFVARLKPIFLAEQVPPALVWLAEVESGFDPQARSPLGAAGLFQLMPFTAEFMGLELRPHDQRLDPLKNARAAAQYLKYLHEKFHDWRLSLAAYNAGEGRVWRLIEKYSSRKYDDLALHLPAETQLYVPKIEATLLRREGVALTDLGAR